MAGQIPLDTKYYPSDFNVTTINLETNSTGQNFPLLYADRDMIIDSINIYISDAPAAAEAIKIIKNSDFATPTYAGTGNSTVMVTEIALATTAGDYPVRYITNEATQTTPKIVKIDFVANTNLLNKGHTMWLAASSVLGSMVNVSVQIRWRSQL
jgi:hypothetical protein